MNRGRLLLILPILLALTACAPNLNIPKPASFNDVLEGVQLPKEAQRAVDEMLRVAAVYQKEVYPYLDQLHQMGTGSPGKMREPVTNGLRGVDMWYLAIKKAEKELVDLEQSPSQSKKVREIAIAGRKLIRELKDAARITAEMLQDADAYSRSWEEWNLSHLNQKNEDSFNRSAQEIKNAEKRATEAYRIFFETLKS